MLIKGKAPSTNIECTNVVLNSRKRSTRQTAVSTQFSQWPDRAGRDILWGCGFLRILNLPFRRKSDGLMLAIKWTSNYSGVFAGVVAQTRHPVLHGPIGSGLRPSAIVVGGRIFAGNHRITPATVGSGSQTASAQTIHAMPLRNG